MKNTSRFASLVALSLAVLFVFASCSNPVLDTGSDAEFSARCLDSGVIPLVVGKNTNVGTVTLTRDTKSLYITCLITDSRYLIGDTQIWVGTDVDEVPHAKNGKLVPDQFRKAGAGNFGDSAEYSPAVSTVTLKVPLAWAKGTRLSIFLHADLVGTSSRVKGESAWAGRDVVDSPKWSYYIDYKVPSVPNWAISGYTFFDVNGNCVWNEEEPFIPGLVITLTDGVVTRTAVSDSDGYYHFDGLDLVEYTLTAGGHFGFMHWPTDASAVITTSAPAKNRNFAYNPDFQVLGYYAYYYSTAFSPEYWLRSIEKAITGATDGQVSAATLRSYLDTFVNTFALEPFASLTLEEARDILSYTGYDNPAAHLARQVLASELNYAYGIRINGDDTLTRLFLYSGEYMVKHWDQFIIAGDPTKIFEAAYLFGLFNNRP